MAYATVDELRAFLTQIPEGADYDTTLGELLDRATSAIDGELGFSLDGYAAAAAKDVRAPGYITDTFALPDHEAGSITACVRVYAKGTGSESTVDPDDWDELDDGRLYRYSGWEPNAWYRITAEWGSGDPTDAIKQLCIEVARDLWYQQDASMSSNTVGVEGAGTTRVQYAWTHRQFLVLQQARRTHGQYGFA